MYRDILYIEVHGKSYVYRKAKMPYNMEWRIYFVLLFETNKELCIARTGHIVVPQQGLVT